MASDTPTVGDLIEAKEIAPDEVDAAVASYLKKPGPGPIALGANYVIDVAAAVEAHKPARIAMGSDAASEGLQRTMVRTAIIMGAPEQG